MDKKKTKIWTKKERSLIGTVRIVKRQGVNVGYFSTQKQFLMFPEIPMKKVLNQKQFRLIFGERGEVTWWTVNG
jgi:hypothetical protein